jgi:periplasmic protein CpxP/Spy
LLLSVVQMGAAQNFPAIDPQTGAAPSIVRPKKPMQQAPAQNFPAIDPQTGAAPPIVRPKKPMQQAPAEDASEQATSSGQQLSGAPAITGRDKKSVPQDPAAAGAQRQSGLSEAQARSLLQQQGYATVNTLQPQPNSLWVWQADAMKNGRPVRLGIDYRGNVLELGATATPCALPGMSPTVGGFGVGARLSEASRCAGR